MQITDEEIDQKTIKVLDYIGVYKFRSIKAKAILYSNWYWLVHALIQLDGCDKGKALPMLPSTVGQRKETIEEKLDVLAAWGLYTNGSKKIHLIEPGENNDE